VWSIPKFRLTSPAIFCKQAGIGASSSVHKRNSYTSHSLRFIIGKTILPTTALPVPGFFIWNTDLAQDILDNSLLPAVFTEVGSRLSYYKIKCFLKCHYQSHFAGGLNASMENYLATWLGEEWEEISKVSIQGKWSSTTGNSVWSSLQISRPCDEKKYHYA